MIHILSFYQNQLVDVGGGIYTASDGHSFTCWCLLVYYFTDKILHREWGETMGINTLCGSMKRDRRNSNGAPPESTAGPCHRAVLQDYSLNRAIVSRHCCAAPTKTMFVEVFMSLYWHPS